MSQSAIGYFRSLRLWLPLLNQTPFRQIIDQSVCVARDKLAFAKLLEGNSRGQPLSFDKTRSLDYKL